MLGIRSIDDRSVVSAFSIYSVYAKYMAGIGFDHTQGAGKTVLSKTTAGRCPVRFDVYIPKNMHRFCFILLVARYSHNHHPPYPTRLPKDVKEKFGEMLRKQDLHSTTTRKYMYSIYSAYAKHISRTSSWIASIPDFS